MRYVAGPYLEEGFGAKRSPCVTGEFGAVVMLDLISSLELDNPAARQTIKKRLV